MRNQIIVGNVGTVIDTDDDESARVTFIEYREISERGEGRAAEENVVWMRDGEIYSFFDGDRRWT